MDSKKAAIIFVLIALAGLFVAFDLGQYLTLSYIKSQQDFMALWYQQSPVLVIGAYFLIYVLVTALSVPAGATLLTLVGGAIFGVVVGTVVVSFASTLGATCAFLVSRYILRDMVQNKFSGNLKSINQGIERDGAFYLFTLRLVPVFPFFMINLVMGITKIKTLQFFWVSQLGMLLGTAVYVNAGTQLAQLESASGILSPGLLMSFALLGVFPLAAKKISDWVAARRVYSDVSKPKRFDQNIVVIGAGAAGLVTSYIAATVKAKVVLVEANKMGGDCLNTGCVPSKGLLRSAKILSYIRRAEEFGLNAMEPQYEFKNIMARIKTIIQKIEPHDSVERYTDLGVQCISARARIKSPYCVEVDGKEITTKNIVIATGARPFIPPIPGLLEAGYVCSDDVWDLEQLPKRLAVMGGGPIGCELSQAFARLGAEVFQVEMMPRLMIREDEEVSQFVEQKFADEGIQVLTEHKVVKVERDGADKVLHCEVNGEPVQVRCDEILVAVGRKANTEGLGIESLDLVANANGTLQVNEYLQTRFPNVLACGDVAGPYQFTHMAAHQAWYASVNALFGSFKKFSVDYSVVPWCTFVDPEVARVGLNEQDAQAENIPYEITRYGIDDLDRAIADTENVGFVKVLTVPGKDKILGVTIVGHHAGELIAEYVLAMRHKLGLNKVLGTIHIYPTLMESNKYAAGEWKRAHAPERLLQWVEKFHRWNRKEY